MLNRCADSGNRNFFVATTLDGAVAAMAGDRSATAARSSGPTNCSGGGGPGSDSSVEFVLGRRQKSPAARPVAPGGALRDASGPLVTGPVGPRRPGRRTTALAARRSGAVAESLVRLPRPVGAILGPVECRRPLRRGPGRIDPGGAGGDRQFDGGSECVAAAGPQRGAVAEATRDRRGASASGPTWPCPAGESAGLAGQDQNGAARAEAAL